MRLTTLTPVLLARGNRAYICTDEFLFQPHHFFAAFLFFALVPIKVESFVYSPSFFHLAVVQQIRLDSIDACIQIVRLGASSTPGVFLLLLLLVLFLPRSGSVADIRSDCYDYTIRGCLLVGTCACALNICTKNDFSFL